jgi:hypothetical protein
MPGPPSDVAPWVLRPCRHRGCSWQCQGWWVRQHAYRLRDDRVVAERGCQLDDRQVKGFGGAQLSIYDDLQRVLDQVTVQVGPIVDADERPFSVEVIAALNAWKAECLCGLEACAGFRWGFWARHVATLTSAQSTRVEHHLRGRLRTLVLNDGPPDDDSWCAFPNGGWQVLITADEVSGWLLDG